MLHITIPGKASRSHSDSQSHKCKALPVSTKQKVKYSSFTVRLLSNYEKNNKLHPKPIFIYPTFFKLEQIKK